MRSEVSDSQHQPRDENDGGGAGQWRGATGSLNVKTVLAPTMAVAWMVSADHPLRGMCGGDDAIPYTNHFEVGSPNEYKIERYAQAQCRRGRRLLSAWRRADLAAILRDPEAVRKLLDEYVSLGAAREKYGVC